MPIGGGFRAPLPRSPGHGPPHRTADDLPVHSFRTLLTDLGTFTASTMQVANGGGNFTLPTQPAPLRQRLAAQVKGFASLALHS